MADEQLLSQQNGKPNGCIFAAVTLVNNQHNMIDNNKLNKCSDGDVFGTNLINSKIGNNNKIIHEFKTDLDETPSSLPPPDGGSRAWCVMISAFLCNSIIFGIINTYGTVYIKIIQYLIENGDPEAGSKACKFTNLQIYLI